MSRLVIGDAEVVNYDDLPEETQLEVDYTEHILSHKRNIRGEVIVNLFELCNLSCKFCTQDHNSVQGMDNILGKFDEIIKAITILKKMRKTEFAIHIMGGELFDDRVPDSVFDDYYDLVLKVEDWAKEHGETVYYGFVSNLVHERIDRVLGLFGRLHAAGINARMLTSYDPATRFNKHTLSVFEKNIPVYEHLLDNVNVVLTAPNIRKFLNRDTPLFDMLYEKFTIVFDNYQPEKHHAIHTPKDHELRDMMIFLLDNYPKVFPVADYISGNKDLHCNSTYTIYPNGRAGRCTIFLNQIHYQQAPRTNAQMEAQWMGDFDCMRCEFFERCGMGCFLQHSIIDSRTMSYCWLKDVHAHVRNMNNV